MSKIAQSPAEYFYDRTLIQNGDECWLWKGFINQSHGYGIAYLGQSQLRAHRLSYLLHKGPIQDGLVVCHSCDMPRCVNPEHLWIGTQRDNLHDSISKGRFVQAQTKSHCIHGHEFTEATTFRKKNGKKECQICRRASRTKYRAKKVAHG